ncbi:NUDIX hydrolase [Wenjunlia vitaminophila]|uniref:NAD(+) diphosphatase n=1 Tax=Wenjunlia vitaminophila TaxID=76728 RepID=A0A0T6LLZ7_WENVI|nr:NUDIX hydrolase [Wenjunlia vitaminophila]
MTCTDSAGTGTWADGDPATGESPALSQPVLPLARTGVDRAAEHRTDEPWLAAAWSHPDTRVLLVCDGKAMVVDHEGPDGKGAELVLVPSFEAPDVGERLFLGVDGAGVAYFALAVGTLPGRMGEAARPAGLREVALLLADRDSGLMVHAVALDHWHRMHRFCARCGQPTHSASAGHVRRCAACGAEHYPRTDPAVIMLVVDDRDRCLLGNHALWPQGRFSTLAGFVEPGESLEQAVRREVAEEVGVRVGQVRYQGSQPHPFPSSLMLGFLATALTTEIQVDGEEMAEARWFTRAELADAVTSGEVIPPNEMSIARRLVELWYGAPLPGPGGPRR